MNNCKYCDNKGNYQLKNGAWCCEDDFRKCPNHCIKNSEGVKRAYREGRKNAFFTSDHREKSKLVRSESVIEKILTNDGLYRANGIIKKYILLYKLKEYKCNICKITEWNNLLINLELDHIDGNGINNTLDNLRFLCPNCHSQTPTFKGKNKQTGKQKVSDEQLIDAICKTKSIRQALIFVGLTPKGGNYVRAFRLKSEIK